eukprot:NODE_8877_length_637_cov_29.361868_g8252_i0.p1 GENE.NODE_8877_length_637_cov_29.361868_g8252_i0~~NODE_8877_length_637_cov_29.361868_g8252_i0.p1  ORF type:complete len:201 (+),score=29.73 NODE_8877_length_637_cov_29.361868_g8252_i0:65-604(+)
MSKLQTSFKPIHLALGIANQNQTPLHIEKVVRSGGVVPRNPSTRSKELSIAIKEYFYGSRCQGGHTLRPHRVLVSFDNITIYKVGGFRVAPYLLPVGATSSVDPCQLDIVQPSENLLHTLGGLSYAQEESDIRNANLAGLVHFQEIDIQNRKFTFLIPSPGALPGKFIIIGKIQWLDGG